jgi:hypothetical protein
VGSDTAPNIEGAANEEVKRLGKIITAPKYPGRTLSGILEYGANKLNQVTPKTYQNEARIIFSRDNAQEALNEILGSRASKAQVEALQKKISPYLINALSGASYDMLPEE